MPDADTEPARVPPPPPEDLASDGPGFELWTGITALYDLRVDELSVLEQAAFEAEMITDLRLALISEPRLLRGSQGQMVIHPIISELRQHRTVLVRLLSQLKLPDLDGDGPASLEAEAGVRSSQARAAANVRWTRRGGA